MSIKDKNIVIFGAGAVGSTVGGWLAPYHEKLFFLDQGSVLENLDQHGLSLFRGETPEQVENYRVKTIKSLKDLERVDYVFLATKNYSLPKVAQIIKDAIGDSATIVAFQNGIENQKILPKYFSKVIYSVVGYNVWPVGPGKFGYQKKGPLVLGTIDSNELRAEKKEISELMNRAVETHVVDDLQAAAYSKLVINLTNSLTTLIGHKQRPVSSVSLFQKVLTNMTYEGVKVLKSANIKECSIGGMPSWMTITAAAKLPQFITRGIFNKNVKKMVISSMAQDVLQNKTGDSELETINGVILELAKKHNVDVPYNREVYRLCRQEFTKPDFVPMDITQVWKEISGNLRHS